MGERQRSILTWPQIHKIRTFHYYKKMDVKEIAKQLNVSKSCIYAVVNQKTWKCLFN